MNPETNPRPSIRFRYLEWTLIIVSLLIDWIDSSFHVFPQETLLIKLGFYCAFTGLSFIFPANCPPWRKRGYIFLEMLLIISAKTMGLDFDLLLFLFIAKSCYLLKRKEVVATVIITGIAYNLSQAWSLPSLLQRLHSHQVEFYDPKRVVLQGVGGYLGASILTVFS